MDPSIIRKMGTVTQRDPLIGDPDPNGPVYCFENGNRYPERPVKKGTGPKWTRLLFRKWEPLPRQIRDMREPTREAQMIPVQNPRTQNDRMRTLLLSVYCH